MLVYSPFSALTLGWVAFIQSSTCCADPEMFALLNPPLCGAARVKKAGTEKIESSSLSIVFVHAKLSDV